MFETTDDEGEFDAVPDVDDIHVDRLSEGDRKTHRHTRRKQRKESAGADGKDKRQERGRSRARGSDRVRVRQSHTPAQTAVNDGESRGIAKYIEYNRERERRLAREEEEEDEVGEGGSDEDDDEANEAGANDSGDEGSLTSDDALDGDERRGTHEARHDSCDAHSSSSSSSESGDDRSAGSGEHQRMHRDTHSRERKKHRGRKRDDGRDSSSAVNEREVFKRMVAKIRDATRSESAREPDRDSVAIAQELRGPVSSAATEWEGEEGEFERLASRKLSTFQYNARAARRLYGFLAQVATLVAAHHASAVRVAAMTARSMIEDGTDPRCEFPSRASKVLSEIQDMGGLFLTPGAEIFPCCNTARVLIMRALAAERFASLLSRARSSQDVLDAMFLFRQICSSVIVSVRRDEYAADPDYVPKDKAFDLAARAANNTFYTALLIIHIFHEGVPGHEGLIDRKAMRKRARDLIQWTGKAYHHNTIARGGKDHWFEGTVRKMIRGLRDWYETQVQNS